MLKHGDAEYLVKGLVGIWQVDNGRALAVEIFWNRRQLFAPLPIDAGQRVFRQYGFKRQLDVFIDIAGMDFLSVLGEPKPQGMADTSGRIQDNVPGGAKMFDPCILIGATPPGPGGVRRPLRTAFHRPKGKSECLYTSSWYLMFLTSFFQTIIAFSNRYYFRGKQKISRQASSPESVEA
jgi:hypothetical protein